VRKSLKIPLFVIIGLIFTVAVIASFIIVTYTADDYRTGLQHLVNDLTDYRIEIGDPFRADISATPIFTAAAVKLFIPSTSGSLKIQKLRLKLHPGALLSGQLQMDVTAMINDAKSLKFLLPKELQAIDSVALTTQITVSNSTFGFRNLQAKGLNSHGLQLNLSGSGLIEDFSAPQPFSELDLRVKIDSPDSTTLQGYLPDSLPELGPVQGSLRLVAASFLDLAAKEIKLNFGKKGELDLQVAGNISKIPVDPHVINTGIDLELSLKTAKTEALGKIMKKSLPEVGPVVIQCRFRGSKKESQIENLDIHCGNPLGVELKSSGNLSFGDASGDPAKIMQKLDLLVAITAPAGADLPAFSENPAERRKVPLSGPLAVTFKLSGDHEKINLNDLSGRFGATVLSAELQARLTGKVPQFTGKVAAQKVSLEDFFVQPVAVSQTPVSQNSTTDKKPETPESEQKLIFSKQPFPRDWLRLFDCDIKFTIDRMIGFQNGFSNLELAVKIDNGNFKIDPAAFSFKGGYAKISLLLDTAGSIPKIKLKGIVDDLDLTGLLTSFDASAPIAGSLTVNTSLDSHGLSPHDLAANLNGNFEVVLEEGRVPNAIMKLIAIDILGWSFDRILMNKKYTEIQCGILALKVEKGVLKSRVFMLESANLMVTGAGTVDLGNEICDLVISPKKKRKFWAVVTPVKIKGSLQDPHIITIPAKEAALLSGGIFLAPQFVLPALGLNYLWEMVSKDKSGVKSPCFEYLEQDSQ
jgi:uncharacterized protein involved in outer membrane biogenesis